MARIVDVRAGERGALLAAMGALGAATAGHTLLETARDALFLAKLPPSTLPWMYLSIALIGLALTKLLPQKHKGSTASLAMLVATVVALGFYALLAGDSHANLYALFIWTGTFGAVVGVELWLLLGAAFDVGQAKRLFGFVGAGAVLGATLGAGAARALAGTLGPRSLLVAAAVTFALGWVPTLLLERKARAETGGAGEDPKPAGGRSLRADLRDTARDPYLRRLGAFFLLGTVTVAIADYVFKATVAAKVPPSELGTTFASAYLVMNALALLVQLGLTGLLLRVLGVKRALVVLPLLILLAAGGMFAFATLSAALVLRATDGALRHSLHKTATELLFLPLSDAERRRAKPVIDLVSQRGGQAVSSGLVLLLVVVGATPELLAGVAAAFAVGWLVFGHLVGAPYVEAFRRRLKRGAIEIDDRIPDLDLGALEALFAALNSSRDAEVMGALELLAAQGRARLIPALILYHPSSEVVLRALPLFVAEGRADFLPVATRLLAHPDPEVRAAALRARAAVQPDVGELGRLAEDERPEIRATALIALLAHGATDAAAARASLRRMLGEGGELVKLSVARAMAAEPHPSFVAELCELASGGEASAVAIEAAKALSKVGERFPEALPRVLEALVALLPKRDEGPVARDALAALGPPALEHLDDLLRTSERKGAVAWALSRALRGYPPALLVPVLLHHLEHSPDGLVRFRVLKQLRRLRDEQPELALDEAVLERVALSTMRDAFWFVEQRWLLGQAAAREAIAATAAGELLAAIFADKLAHAMGRLFLLAGLIYPREDFQRVARGLASKDNKTRASSRELCDNVLKPPLRERFLLLIDDRDDAARLDDALGRERPTSSAYGDLVRGLCKETGEVGAMARYRAAELALEIEPAPTSLAPSEGGFIARIAAARPSRPRGELPRG